MEPLISVIVPIYKVEPYLKECVDSILNQTYRNLEVILVDDGSPDNCGAICDSYAAQDSRVKVIHQENGGLSSARNAGLSVASGEYITFVDSDDALVTDAMEYMLHLAEKEGADIVIGNDLRFEDDLPTVRECEVNIILRNKEEAMAEFFQNGCAAWGRLYRREIHEGIAFPVGEINEDEAIVLKLLERCRKTVKTTATVYYYRCRPESITTTSFHAKKLIWVRHCLDNLNYIEAHHPDLVPDAAARYYESLLWALRELSILGQNMDEEWHQLRRELRSMLSRSQNRNIIRALLLAYFPRKWLNNLFHLRMKLHCV